MIYQAVEGTILWIPGIDPSVLPAGLPAGISIHSRRGELGILADGLVGSVGFSNGDTLHITPKIGDVNFLKLFFRAEGNLGSLNCEFDEFVQYSLESESNIGSLVARSLFKSLNNIQRRSPLTGRKSVKAYGKFAVGEISFVETSRLLAAGFDNPVVSRVKSRITDIPENRLLVSALLAAWPMLSADDRLLYGHTKEYWLKRFPKSPRLADDLEIVGQKFSANKYGGARDYYSKALMYAKVILSQHGLGFDKSASYEGNALLINTADIFEKYIRNTINNHYSKYGYVVSKGGIGDRTLYTDGSYSLIPDVLVAKNNDIVLLADAKYKNPTANDHYQMAAYLMGYGKKQGILLAPSFTSDSVTVREYVTPNKVIVREIYIPLHAIEVADEMLSKIVDLYGS